MNQGNNQNLNNVQGNIVGDSSQMNQTPVNPMPAPTPSAPVAPAMPTQTPVSPVQPTQVVQPVQNPNANGQVVQPMQTPVNANAQNQSSVVSPTQNVIMTNKKKTSVAFIFIAVILVGLFIYFIDDILAYFNQNYSPVIENTEVESSSANLTEGMIKIGEQTSYIKIKYIRFYNVKKSNNQIFISYLSDKNYNNVNELGIIIQLFNAEKEILFEDNFSVSGSVESGKTRQYKIIVEEDTYNDAVYALIKTN